MPLEYIVAGVAVIAITAYGLLAGADFGGGILDLFARGTRGKEQQQAIAKAIGPVWETNHIWLILVVVLLFTCFPIAFADLSIALAVPFTLVLVGIVLRGTSFVFRAHAEGVAGFQRGLGVIFAVASMITPGLLGTCIGAVSTGAIHINVDGQILAESTSAWYGWFALSCGALAQALCTYLAAVYLTVATSGQVQEDFRQRAFGSGIAVTITGIITFLLMPLYAPHLWENMAKFYVTPLIGGGVIFAAISVWTLWTRQYKPARIFAAGQVCLIFWGWAAAQAPYIITPGLSLTDAAAPSITLKVFLYTLLGGSFFLIPSLALLFFTFSGLNPAAANDESAH